MIAVGVEVLDRRLSGMGTARELPNLELEVLVCVMLQSTPAEAIETGRATWSSKNPLDRGLIDSFYK